MKILVGVKHVIDRDISIRVKADGSGVETTQVKWSMNPFDEVALEGAIRLKEGNKASGIDEVDEIIAVSIGSRESQATLRTAMAMGADRAILIEYDGEIDALAVAKLLKKLVIDEGVGMVLLGKQAIDTDAGQTGQMLSALLGWSQATFVSHIDMRDDSSLIATREIDGGQERLQVPLPAVITADLRLNEPRFATLPNIIKAKKQPIERRVAAEAGVDLTPRLTQISVREPTKRPAGVIVTDVNELIDKLKNEAKVI